MKIQALRNSNINKHIHKICYKIPIFFPSALNDPRSKFIHNLWGYFDFFQLLFHQLLAWLCWFFFLQGISGGAQQKVTEMWECVLGFRMHLQEIIWDKDWQELSSAWPRPAAALKLFIHEITFYTQLKAGKSPKPNARHLNSIHFVLKNRNSFTIWNPLHSNLNFNLKVP